MCERNNISLLSWLDGRPVSHFRAREFESAHGWLMVHPSVLLALERVRANLAHLVKSECFIIVTGSTRSEFDNAALGARLGFVDEGGLVARNSRHLEKYGGIAVDFYALVSRTRRRVPQRVVGQVARNYFSYVKDNYADGHIHADQR